MRHFFKTNSCYGYGCPIAIFEVWRERNVNDASSIRDFFGAL